MPSFSSPSSAAKSAAKRPPPTTSISDFEVKPEHRRTGSNESPEDIIPEIVVSIDNMEFIEVDSDSDDVSMSPPPDEEEDEAVGIAQA